MPAASTFLHGAFLILVIIALFNITIFVHELGHFLAAKWRGLKIERFQIWFGTPIWKKTINGVQYGLGWIPAGGFVALPQMAPMEAIEGDNSQHAEPLPPISPLDKIIVAIAGPLFSILLALTAALVVSKVGKPADMIQTREVGLVVPDGPAHKAGIRVGDTITAINGKPVIGFAGDLDCITESIVLSRGDKITFTVERPGELKPLEIVSSFEIKETRWWQRRSTRKVGIGPKYEQVFVRQTIPNSPAAKANLQTGDRLVSVNGQDIHTMDEFIALTKAAGESEIALVIERSGQFQSLKLTPTLPVKSPEMRPQLGILAAEAPKFDEGFVYPGAWKQIASSGRMMWTTISSLIARDSSIGLDQMSGPIGIAKVKYQMLDSDFPFHRVMWFMVVFNVNLAIFNMLPLPVLDGGHITLAILEWIARRPVRARVLEIIQTGFALMIFALFLYITSKDLVGDVGKRQAPEPEKIDVEFAP